MNPDYYQILGVSPDADADAIRAAHRAEIKLVHPDRGGSHQATVLVNEALHILRDPQRRRRYDQSRVLSAPLAARTSAANDAQQARQQAEDYPRQWSDVDAWLGRLASDFMNVNYGETNLYAGISIPTAAGSVSGFIFIAAGVAVGAVFGSIPLVDLFKSQNVSVDTPPELALVGFPAFVGAWVGWYLHRAVGFTLRASRSRPNRRNSPAAPPPATEPPRDQRELPADLRTS